MANQITPGKKLFSQIRAGFIAQGTSYSKWCRENGVSRQNAKLSLIGVWDGPKSRAIRERIINAAEIAVEAHS